MGETSFEHVPVLCEPLLAGLSLQGHETILDCTVGSGGHSLQFFDKALSHGGLIGLDFDETQLELARGRLARYGDRVGLYRRNFAECDAVLAELGLEAVDVILADLGVSSVQLDDSARGLSFLHDGPLDMRLDLRQGTKASDLVNSLPESALADLLFDLAQESHSRKIARRICRARHDRRIRTTGELADIVAGAAPGGVRGKIHPATRTFLALRVAVNDEVSNLERLLDKVPRLLRPGGRVAVISFQSTEDRLVKRSFQRGKRAGVYRIRTPKPIVADQRERAENPRSRSAKLRIAERTDDAHLAHSGEHGGSRL